MTAGQASNRMSSFAGVVLVAHLLGRTMKHGQDIDDIDLTDAAQCRPFWERHAHLDTLISTAITSFPAALRLPTAVKEPHIVYTHMNMHALIISLHQTAIKVAGECGLGSEVTQKSHERCLAAADEIVNILRLTSHLELTRVSTSQ